MHRSRRTRTSTSLRKNSLSLTDSSSVLLIPPTTSTRDTHVEAVAGCVRQGINKCQPSKPGWHDDVTDLQELTCTQNIHYGLMSRGSRYLMIWWRKDLLETRTLGAGLASTNVDPHTKSHNCIHAQHDHHDELPVPSRSPEYHGWTRRDNASETRAVASNRCAACGGSQPAAGRPCSSTSVRFTQGIAIKRRMCTTFGCGPR